jgi:hypothetical protein
MKYLIKTTRTELYNMRYLIEANSEEEAIEKFKGDNWQDITDYDDEFVETINEEIVDVITYNEDV